MRTMKLLPILKDKRAFTLAETLITLMIIGVIAALTIPAIMQKTHSREHVAQLKKAYASLSQATDLIISETGPVQYWKWSNPQSIMDLYKKRINDIKECDKSSGCFTNKTIKYLDGTADQNYDSNASSYKYTMADGVTWKLDVCTEGGSCTPGDYGLNAQDAANVYANIVVDVNGSKSPNQWGRDVFLFNLVKDGGLIPAGSDSTANCNNRAGTGFDCTAKVLQDGNMDY